MRLRALSFSSRLTLALALVLLAFALLITLLGRSLAASQEQEALQRLSHGLARHIVGHWPEISHADPAQADAAARQALLQMLMVVNPGIQVYLLDADGQVAAYIGAPGMVRQGRVDLRPVRAFLAGAALPLHGTDPMGGSGRIFSAAMFPQRPGQTRPPGYLYIVLDGAARTQVAADLSRHRWWLGAAAVAGAAALCTLLLGGLALRRLTRPLHRLARSMHGYSLARPPGGAMQALPAVAGDEVQAIAGAWAGMTARIEQQAARELLQASAHREMMAGVAHDLRTPLTALHGHLEALAAGTSRQAQTLLRAALSQSDKVRRLSQQLFELATLQASDEVLHRERFRLDELVSDAVQKFALGRQPPGVLLDGPPPGRLELDGDLQLVERALVNLIDNALRHAPQGAAVRIRLQRAGGLAQILVEDDGPGLPAAVHSRLQAQGPLRDPPIQRSGGGIGGLGLAIAQRVAQLHGGSLLPLPVPQGGTRLCLALPLAG